MKGRRDREFPNVMFQSDAIDHSRKLHLRSPEGDKIQFRKAFSSEFDNNACILKMMQTHFISFVLTCVVVLPIVQSGMSFHISIHVCLY